MSKERLVKQVAFILEIDKIKSIVRQNYLADGSRRENDAEHSWHLAVMAILLSEYFEDRKVDMLKVIKMVLIHDLIEVYAGDTYCYDVKGAEDKAEREMKAAERLFGILPEDQQGEWMNLWEEFECCTSEEAKFAAILDRLQPLLLNYSSEGKSWREHGITGEQAFGRNKLTLSEGPEEIKKFVRETIEDAVKKGYLDNSL